MLLIDHKWPPMEENLGEMERKVEPLKPLDSLEAFGGTVRALNDIAPTTLEYDRPDLTAEDIEEALRVGTGPAMEPPDEVA